MVMLPAPDPRGGITQRFGELLTQLQSGPEQPHLRVRLAETESIGGFANGKSFHVPQQKHEPMFLIQPPQSLVEQALGFMLLNQLLWGLPPIRDELRVGNRIVLL
jgi:hypothetical protein